MFRSSEGGVGEDNVIWTASPLESKRAHFSSVNIYKVGRGSVGVEVKG